MGVVLLVAVLLCTTALCRSQSPFNFKCKPKLGCDFSKCDPIPEELIGMEGFDVELYRKQNNYHITCSPAAPIGFIKGIKGDPGTKGEPGNFGRSLNAVAAKGEKGDRGDEGKAGIPGVAGQKGEKGETGSNKRGNAFKGSKGDKGVRGFRGYKGDKGSSGSGISNVLLTEMEKAKKARKDLEVMIQEEKTKRTELEKRLLSAEGLIQRMEKKLEKRIDEKFQELMKKMSDEITQKLLEFAKPQKPSTVTTESTNETPWFPTAETTTTPLVETPWSFKEETKKSRTPTTKNPQHEKCAYVDGKRCFLPLNNEIGYYDYAKRRCENARGGLADIRNEMELNAIMDYVRKHGMEWESKLEFYVGMTYLPQTKQVYLRNGSTAPFVLWHPTYPKTYGDKMTLVIRKSPEDGWQYFTNTDGSRMAQPLCLILLN